ncbi:MAG: SDR family oxidoreductase [Dehalogenimonas sp.]|uniref:SDR family oxidoreductase n=1 Tax=Candidatus Dehalogenimonas loeffleri TaxID=3127115 RepID=A0ABZ2J9D9_9CHLR|nr:SDR family oxidoreductase [Dehalogenimonas sp.]
MEQTISQLFDLSGKTAIVTGGAAGIGKAIAFRLAEAGANVVVSDINLDNARATVAEIRNAGFKARENQTDTSKPASAQRTIQETLAAFGDLHILVNNAGVYPFSSASDLTEEIWDRTLNINLKGTMFFAQAAAKAMMEKGHGGKIINLASVDAFHPTGNLAAYNASKGGVVMLTKALAQEWTPKGVTVNAIAPGPIMTSGAAAPAGLTQEQLAGMLQGVVATIPLGRIGQPDDIARVALFLASQGADFISGATIVADGGYLVG